MIAYPEHGIINAFKCVEQQEDLKSQYAHYKHVRWGPRNDVHECRYNLSIRISSEPISLAW